MKRADQECRHLSPRDWKRWAEVCASTSLRDTQRSHPIYEIIEGVRRRHVCKPLRCRRRRIQFSERSNNQRRRLLSQQRIGWTVVRGIATLSDVQRCKAIDEIVERI